MLVVAVTILAILGVPLEKSNLLQAEPRYVAPKAPLKAVPAEVQHVAPKAPLKAVPAEVQRVAPKAPMKAVPAEVQRVAPKAPAERAEVLVIVSDHGSGTTDFGDALNTHPCMFDLGEPFANPTGLWSNSVVEGCQYPEAIFGQDSGRQLKNSNDQMTTRINHIARSKPVGMKPSKTLSGTDPSMYKDLKYNLGEYFVRARDLICANVPADVCPPSDCSITLKMFPQFVDGITFGVRTSIDKKHVACQNAQNEMAMVAWKDALTSFKRNPKVAAITLERDELQRQFSMFHRMDPLGTDFDCSIPRVATAFATVSKDYTDAQIQVEDCWGGARGASKCLGDALALVGLSVKLDSEGTADMTGEVAEREKAHEMTSRSCATDPLATFKLLKNDQVGLISQRPTGGAHSTVAA